MSIAPNRITQLMAMLEDILEANSLAPGAAGKVWGRLAFACTQLFGRYGRAKLRPFSRRQHESSQYRLNMQLREAILWWLEELPKAPPRTIPTSLSRARTVVSYSDGGGSEAQVGIAVWVQGESRARAGVLKVPQGLRNLQDQQRRRGRFNDIYEIEAVGPLLVLDNFPIYCGAVFGSASSTTPVLCPVSPMVAHQ